MKLYKKIFAIAIAMLGVTGLHAQTDVTDIYLTNAGFDDSSSWATSNVKDNGDLRSTNGWTSNVIAGGWNYAGSLGYGTGLAVNSATIPSTNPDGKKSGGALGISVGWGGAVAYQQKDVTLPAGIYTLSYKAYNANASATQANNYIGFTTSTNNYYGQTISFTSNTWVEESINFTLTSETTGNVSVGIGAISGGSGANAKLFIDGLTLTHKPFIDVTESNSVDLTSMSVGNWLKADGSVAGTTGTSACGGLTGVSEAYQWGNCLSVGDNALHKTITSLPSGLYRIEIYCASSTTSNRDNGNYPVEDGDEKYVTLTANGTEYNIPTYNRTTVDQVQSYTFDKLKVEDGNLNLAVNIKVASPNWLMAKVKSIVFLGPDKTLYEAAFNEKISKLNGLNASDYPTAFVTEINNLKSTYGSKDAQSMTLSELENANNALDVLLNKHDAVKAEYAKLNSCIDICNEYALESYSSVEDETIRNTFKTAISKADTEKNNASDVAGLVEVYNTLETSRQTFVKVAIPTTGKSYDMTFLIKNPSFETGDLTGWTVTPSSDTGVRSNSNGTYKTEGADGDYLFNTYWKGTPLTQEITGMPSGVYEMKVLVASDGSTVYLTADGEHNEGTMTSDKTIFLESTIKFVCTDGVTVIGVVGGADGDKNAHKDFTAEGYWWYKADNFRLYRSFDPTTAQNNLKDIKGKANSLLSKPMNKSVKDALEEEINSVDVASDNPFLLSSMAQSLNDAIAETEASIIEYEKIKTYIEMTKVFTDVTTYETKYNNGEYTSADVEPTRQELNVIRFNAASAVYTNKVEVTGWTGTMGERSDQHWSGKTVSYKDANSWSDTEADALTTKINLTKGTYVLKVAGRSHANATLTLEVLGQTITFHAKGDTGYGIDVNGNATFSADATYANGNAGRGWEWEFLKFTVDSDQEVELKVNSDYNNKEQVWTSFGDITLWMDDDTYVNVNGGAIDAPKAEAESIVNTLPMGEAENTALQNAIAACDTKAKNPAELNAQIEGLKTAVANANAWRTVYYAKKDTLVAALERFEADYNDAENGSLDYMNKNRWTTVIEKVQAAAVAKDNQTSHAVLTTATNELTEALDAATVSVNEYAALESAIDEANTLVAANVGDQPFEKPQSAADAINTTDEQAVYDAATADGKDVTSLTNALKEGIATFNNTPLNAPKEGQRFYIKVATEGHSKLGNAVLATLGATGDNNPTGYGFNCNNAVKGYLNQAFTFTQSEGNKYYISIERPEGSVYMTTGEANGSAAGWNKSQIQATTDADKKAEFEIVSGSVDGVYMIRNLTTNNFIDCQDGGSIYTDDGITKEAFNLVLAEEHTVTLEISAARWSTLILPFDAEVPENVIAYSFEGVNDGVLKFNKADKIKANTPYLVNGKQGNYPFAGYGLADKDTYTIGKSQTDGQFTGTYVDYPTKSGENTWVLQKDKNTGAVAFLIVGTSFQPEVKANRCYITYDSGTSEARMLRFGFDDETTGIDNMQFPTDNSGVTIYDTMGRKVTSMKKGNLYIMNGRKVVVK